MLSLSHAPLIGDPSTMATSRYKDKDGGVLYSFSGVWISWLHTILAYCTPSLSLSLFLVSRSWSCH